MNKKLIIKEIAIDLEPSLNNEETLNWEQLCEWLHYGMLKINNESSDIHDNYILMIDDLEAMEITSSESNISSILFISKCLNRMYNNDSNCQGIIGFGRKIAKDHLSSSSINISDYCRNRADITIEINPLTTGYSVDTHGVIKVHSRSIFPSSTQVIENQTIHNNYKIDFANTSRIWQQSLLFKALDTGIKCSVIKAKISITKGLKTNH